MDNLIWVYSPSQGSSLPVAWLRPVDWCYPGDEYAGIIAGTGYSDKPDINDYTQYQSMGKLPGIAEYGRDLYGKFAKNGNFDTARYARRLLDDYPVFAYWVS